MPPKKKMSEKTDKRYRGRVRVDTEPDGTPVYKWASGKTKAELEQNKAKLKAYYVTGLSNTHDIVFEEYAAIWIESKVTKVKPTTANGLRSTLRKHLLPAFGGRRMRAITSLDIQGFIDTYEGRRKGTVDDVMYCLRQLFKYAKTHRYISENPTLEIERPKTTKKKVKALDPKFCPVVEHIALQHDEGLLIGILYYAGLRRGEALGLHWEDINFKTQRITVNREVVYINGRIAVYEESELDDDLKSEAAQRVVPMPIELVELMMKYRKPSGIILCAKNGYYLSNSTYRRRWDRLMEFGGFPVVKNRGSKSEYIKADEDKKDVEINARVLRHTYSTILAASKINNKAIQYIMGHEDYSTTANIYTDVQEPLLAQAQEQIKVAFSKHSQIPPI